MFWPPSATVAPEPSARPTRRFDRARSGIVAAATAARPIPIQLAPGCSPAMRSRPAATAMEAASTTNDAAIRRWASRSDRSGSATRRPLKSQTTTVPLATSIRLSSPNPTSATDPAARPAATATANSSTCHPFPAQASMRARRIMSDRERGSVISMGEW